MSVQFLGNWPTWLLVATGLSLLAAVLYRRQFGQQKIQLGYCIILLRSMAIFLVAMTLSQPIWETQRWRGTPANLTIILDDSQSMSLRDELQENESSEHYPSEGSRYARAVDGMISDQSWLEELKNKMSIRVVTSSNPQQALWQSTPLDPSALPLSRSIGLPANWMPEQWFKRSPLGDAISSAMANSNSSEEHSIASEYVVLLSDGQSNAGRDALTAAEDLANRNIQLFTVGFGAESSPVDLAVVDLQHPQSVFQADTLRGALLIQERIPAGTRYTATIGSQDDVGNANVLWQQQLLSTESDRRKIDFEIAIAEIKHVLTNSEQGGEYSRYPVALHAQLTSAAREPCVTNNRLVSNLAVIAQRSRVLFVDGRSRWESRYLRNMFSRDPAWEIESHILHQSSSQLTARLPLPLGLSNEQIDAFELMILGDIDCKNLESQDVNWLHEFVEKGGGLVLLDGARRQLRASASDLIGDLLPVQWLGKSDTVVTAVESLPKRVALTEVGMRLQALRIDTSLNSNDMNVIKDDASNLRQWSQLEPLNFVARVKALPGAETLIDAISDVETTPLLVTRRYGAGRVLYCATDETWRWRFKAADTVHQRLWSQLARWVQRRPMAVKNEFVSLDTGAAQVLPGHPVELLSQLKDMSGDPASGKSVMVVLASDAQLETKIALIEHTDLPGTYSAIASNLPEGHYRVRLLAEDYPQEALNIETELVVTSEHRRELLDLTCNRKLLTDLAQATGGKYYSENDLSQLAQQLRPVSGIRLENRSVAIWQSYMWFLPALTLLTMEWILRKRAGLV
ncbi:MAG: VWA domain-containing protein [Planctomycetales bacterium]|nr:VWA domain-containing protein [Planctomycetales bacterium]